MNILDRRIDQWDRYWFYIARSSNRERSAFSIYDFIGDRPAVIEYCSGNGEWVVSKAITDPETAFIAVEKKPYRAKKIYNAIERNNLSNLFVVAGDAVLFSDLYLSKNSIEKCYIHFPDPWPKRRHHKNRFINREFISILEKILKKGGGLEIITDHEGYRDHLLENLSLSRLESFHEKGYISSTDCLHQSYFSRLFAEQNRKFFLFSYIKR